MPATAQQEFTQVDVKKNTENYTPVDTFLYLGH